MSEKDYLLKILDFIGETEKLKDVHRSGFTSAGKPESTAEHSWRLGLLALLLMDGFEGCDSMKILSMCLVHDLGELDGGDIPAIYEVAQTIKYASEEATINRITALLPVDKGNDIKDLWQEYNEGVTPEAKIVKALDKMETIMQHNQGHNPVDFDYGFNLGYGKKFTEGNRTLELLRALVDEMTMNAMKSKGHQ